MTDYESRGAAIILPGATLAELPDQEDEAPPNLIKVNGKLYIREDSPLLTPRDKKQGDPTTGSPVLDTMLQVVGKSMADTQAQMQETYDDLFVPTAKEEALVKLQQRLGVTSEGPGTVVRNMTWNTVALPGGGILRAGQRVLVPTADVLGDTRYRDYIAKGILRCTEILRIPEQKKKKKLDLDFTDDTGGWGDDE